MTAAVTTDPQSQMIRPANIAALVAIVFHRPTYAVVSELVVNCRLESML